MDWTVLVIVDTMAHVLVLQHILLTHNSVVGFARGRFRDCTAAIESCTSFEAWLLELSEDCGRVLSGQDEEFVPASTCPHRLAFKDIDS